jgi:hypothetical protein
MEWLLVPYMAFMFRARGGSLLTLPRPIEQALYALPYGVIVFLSTGLWYLAVLGWTASTIAVIKGHGHNMDLGTYTKDADYEWYEFLIKKLHGKIPEYWYDVIGISVSGLTYTIVPGLLMLNPIVALSGLSKGLAYMIGWKWFNKTETGEWLTGGFAGALIAVGI